jgi:hypothetical protein
LTPDLDLPTAFMWPKGAVPKNEKAFRKKFVKKFVAEHPGCWIHTPREMLRSGIPDLLAVFQGHAFAFELKMQGNKPTPMQLVTIADLDVAGAWARFIVQGRDGVVRSLRYDEV